jgi:acyl-CoA reductase-like NAD-dependent aldehyde dehydrogenase
MTVLEKFSELSSKIYVDGTYRASAATTGISVIDPATENTLGEIPETTPAEMDEAVAKANAAQKAWNKLSPLDRSHALHEVANTIASMTEPLAEALTREMGKPYKESADEVHWSVHNIRFYAETGRGEIGKVIGSAVEGQFHYTLKQPLGTCVLILPFNYPMVLLAWEASAALAAGNAVIIKPSQYTSLTTLLFAEAFKALPEGLFQVVTGEAPAGKYLVEHPDTHMVAFTGSVPVGVGVAETCGRLMKRCLIENSGNDPFIIMPSAPMDITARAAAFSAYMNCGQICVLRRALLRS